MYTEESRTAQDEPIGQDELHASLAELIQKTEEMEKRIKEILGEYEEE